LVTYRRRNSAHTYIKQKSYSCLYTL